MKNSFWILFFVGFFLASPLLAEKSFFDDFLFDSSMSGLEEAIHDTGHRHAVYSYNIANATTQGFKPILLDDDQRQFFQLIPKNSEYFSKVVIEHMSSKMALNRVRQAALFALYKKKFDNYRQVVSLGKK